MLRKFWTLKSQLPALLIVGATCLASATHAHAASGDEALFVANNIWMMVATFLVFIMHLGFATLESGLTRAKNTVNIL